MQKSVNVKSSSTIPLRIAAALATLHLLAIIAFAIHVHQSNESQEILLWTLWTPIDFPISMFVPWGLEVLPSGSEWSSTFRLVLPYFVHGVLGTMWWFFLPFIFSWLFRKILGSEKKTSPI